MGENNFRGIPYEIKFNDVRNIVERDDPINGAHIPESVQLLRLGKFHHPRFGEIDITTEMFSTMIHNFNEDVRGVDCAIDYKHDSDDIAAGWIQELFLSADESELWARVKWTPRGEKILGEKEFRYLSADFTSNFVDPETLKEFGHTLNGAGLTNRPFVKRMQAAVPLSEMKNAANDKGNQMAKPNEHEVALTEAKDKIESLEAQLAESKDESKKLSEELGEEKAKLEEFEMSPEEMVAMIKDLKAKIADLEGKAQFSEKEKEFNKFLSEGKAVEAQRDSWMSGDIVKFAELSGDVNLGEGKGKEGEADKKSDLSAQDQVLELAEAKFEETKKENPAYRFDDAISDVLGENEVLGKKYLEETTI